MLSNIVSHSCSLFSIVLMLGLSFPLIAQDKSTPPDSIEEIWKALPEEEKDDLMKFAEYLYLKSKESDEEKEERIYKADNNIPSEETVDKIMEYSRYLTATQDTPQERMEKEDIPTTIVRFKTRSLDFGEAKEGEVIQLTYHFTNTGKHPLVLYDVTTPCGCTVADWSKEPILPGETQKINVTFDTKTKKGKQTKLVKILANTEEKEISLFIKGNILP